MKGPSSIDNRVVRLIQQVIDGIESKHGFGSMSPAVYDSAWLAMLSKPVGGNKVWLFPECLDYVLSQQQEDGSWPSYASAIDGILNTAASLLCLQRHLNALAATDNQIDFAYSVDRAKTALQRLLDQWHVASTVHVGFEIVVPALLEYLDAEGMRFTFPGYQDLLNINAAKLGKFKPEYLYGTAQLTALHSLEAFIGKIDFDKVIHHKVDGSFMASPSSTAAYLMHASVWDDDCEQYLRRVVRNGAGRGGGGVPSAWPSTTFEATWIVSTLLDAGVGVKSLLPAESSRIVDYLSHCIEAGKGTTGFAPSLTADADDTAKSILILNLLGKPTSPSGLVKHFEDEVCFKTYPLERDPSFSANVNCLIALLHSPDPMTWRSQISKILKFLCSQYERSEFNLRDKWNISPHYSLMLLAQALSQALKMARNGNAPALTDEDVLSRAKQLLKVIADVTLRSIPDDTLGPQTLSTEETAYALIALAATQENSDRSLEVRGALCRGHDILKGMSKPSVNHLWVEKVTFGSSLLFEAYMLAALQSCNASALSNGSSAETDDMKGLSNRQLNNGHETEFGTNEFRLSSSDHVRNDSVLNYVQPSFPSIRELGTPRSWSEENETLLTEPYRYLDRRPGKDLRGAFIDAFNTWLHVPADRLSVIKNVIRMLHTSSLLVDDIEDNSELRRGTPVAHGIFGVPQTFNSANYVYFKALKAVRGLRNDAALDAFVDELVNLHRGQGLDLYWRDSLTCPTEAEYLEMVGNKTGGLFRLALRLMQAESKTDRDLLPIVSLLGLNFQICDDYLNLTSAAYTDTKGYCEDLTEGKFSFPVIHSIRADPSSNELVSILRQKPRAVEVKKYAVELMKRTGSLAYTRSKVAELKVEVESLIAQCESEGWEDASSIRKLVSRASLSSDREMP